MFKLSDLVDHHRLLARDHLGAHRVEEVSGLLESEAFFVELLCILCDRVNSLGNLESMLSEDTGIFDESDKLGRVVYF